VGVFSACPIGWLHVKGDLPASRTQARHEFHRAEVNGCVHAAIHARFLLTFFFFCIATEVCMRRMEVSIV